METSTTLAMAALLTEDAEWINIVGWWWRGQPSVRRGFAWIHEGMLNRYAVACGLRLGAVSHCGYRDCQRHWDDRKVHEPHRRRSDWEEGPVVDLYGEAPGRLVHRERPETGR